MPLMEITATKGIRITGSLADGWGDNSNWKNNVVADYKPISEGGRRFLRVRQTSGDGLQFMHGLPGMEKKNGYYRLTFTARSRTGVSLGVRDLGSPYGTLSSFTPATDGRWRDSPTISASLRILRRSACSSTWPATVPWTCRGSS